FRGWIQREHGERRARPQRREYLRACAKGLAASGKSEAESEPRIGGQHGAGVVVGAHHASPPLCGAVAARTAYRPSAEPNAVNSAPKASHEACVRWISASASAMEERSSSEGSTNGAAFPLRHSRPFLMANPTTPRIALACARAWRSDMGGHTSRSVRGQRRAP